MTINIDRRPKSSAIEVNMPSGRSTDIYVSLRQGKPCFSFPMVGDLGLEDACHFFIGVRAAIHEARGRRGGGRPCLGATGSGPCLSGACSRPSCWGRSGCTSVADAAELAEVLEAIVEANKTFRRGEVGDRNFREYVVAMAQEALDGADLTPE